MATYDVTTAATSLEFDTQNATFNNCINIDDNHFVNSFIGATANNSVLQVFAVNTSTWAVTTVGTALVGIQTTNSLKLGLAQIDSNHFISNWCNTNSARAQVFEVNTTTWAVTTSNSSFVYDTTAVTHEPEVNAIVGVDANHFLSMFGGGPSSELDVIILAVNTSTWAVTTSGSLLTIETTLNSPHSSCVQIDSNHILAVWALSGIGLQTQVMVVNTSTWAISTAQAKFQIGAVGSGGGGNSVEMIDSNHAVIFYQGAAGDGFVQVVTINTSTWAISTASSALEFDTVNGYRHSCQQIDDNHFINFFSGNSFYGYVQVFTIDTSTWAITTTTASLEFDTTQATDLSSVKIDAGHYVCFWTDVNSDGFVQTFTVELTPPSTPGGKSIFVNHKNSILII